MLLYVYLSLVNLSNSAKLMWGCINQDISSTAVQIYFPTSFSSTKYGMALSWFDYNNNIGVKLTETASSYFKVIRQSTYGTKKALWVAQGY